MGLSYHIKPFDGKDQKDFLVQYWTKTLSSEKTERTKRLQTHAQKLLEIFSKPTNAKEHPSINILLQTRMIAEIFQKKSRKFYNSREAESNPSITEFS